MKTILAAACIDPTSVFDAAFLVAERFGAHVVGLGGARPTQAVQSWNENAGAVAFEGMLLLEHEEEERNRRARKSFLAAANGRGIPIRSNRGQNGPSAEWRYFGVPGKGTIGSFHRAFDLVVVEQPADVASFAQARLDGAILESGRPVLMVPTQPQGTLGRRVMIVWRGSISCSRSVAMAMPFLSKAERVDVISTSADAMGSCVELERSLAAHVAFVSVRYLAPRREMDGDAVVSEARTSEADLIVAGAYCRSWILELFGQSLTKSLVKIAETPVLFAH
jgi:nucleotide-binding universal stress UspA family protein